MTAPKHGSRILIVDDDPLNRKLLDDLLTHEGYRTRVASNADEALDHLANGRYHLLITDIEMPGRSGLELIRKVREQGLRFPILVVSANPPGDVRAAAGDEDRVECLLKPFGIDAVRSAVERLLTPTRPHRPPTPKPGKAEPRP